MRVSGSFRWVWLTDPRDAQAALPCPGRILSRGQGPQASSASAPHVHPRAPFRTHVIAQLTHTAFPTAMRAKTLGAVFTPHGTLPTGSAQAPSPTAPATPLNTFTRDRTSAHCLLCLRPKQHRVSRWTRFGIGASNRQERFLTHHNRPRRPLRRWLRPLTNVDSVVAPAGNILELPYLPAEGLCAPRVAKPWPEREKQPGEIPDGHKFLTLQERLGVDLSQTGPCPAAASTPSCPGRRGPVAGDPC